MKELVLTLGIPVREGEVLLGLKKRGFGAGRWNGFGGKVKPGESVMECLHRELSEEAGIVAQELEQAGIFQFVFPQEELRVHLFRIGAFTGVPSESEEMRPSWFSFSEIPFESMWPDDKYWLPYFLSGKKFKARFEFKDQDTLVSHQIVETEKLPTA